MRQITTEEKYDSIIDSSYGKLTYGAWCEKEVERIKKNGGEAVIKRVGDNVCIMLTKFGNEFTVERWPSCLIGTIGR